MFKAYVSIHIATIIYIGNVDYTAGLYNITFSAEDVTTTFNISITDDNLLEAIEEFNLTISSISSSRILSGNTEQATVFIVDNDGKYIINLNGI